MKHRVLLILIGLCYCLQAQADNWVIIDTVGIVNIDIEANYSDSKRERYREKMIIKRVRRTAKKIK